MTNEQRARLIGLYVGISDPPELAPVWMNMGQGSPHCIIADAPPSFDTDANAVAELRKFVRARGEWFAFIAALRKPVGYWEDAPTGMKFGGSGVAGARPAMASSVKQIPAESPAPTTIPQISGVRYLWSALGKIGVFKDELEKL